MGVSKHMGASKHMGDVQTYGGQQNIQEAFLPAFLSCEVGFATSIDR